MNRYLRLVIPAIVAIILVTFVIFLVGLGNLVSMFLKVSNYPEYLLLFLIVYVSAFFLRAKRLQIIVGEERISYGFYMKILIVSWFVNSIIPIRIGEGVELALLNSEHDVPIGSATASVVTAKLFDITALLIVFSGLLFSVGMKLQQEFALEFFYLLSLGVLLCLLFGIILVALIPDRLNSMIKRGLGRWPKISIALCSFIDSASMASKKIGNSKRKILSLLIISIPIWMLQGSTLFFVSKAVGYNFPIADTMTASISAFASMIVPISPGGFGTYELVAGFLLSILIVNAPLQTVAIPLAFTEHLLRQVTILIMGSIATLALGINFKGLFELTKKHQLTESRPSDS